MDVRGAVMASRGGGGGTELIYCQRLDVVITIKGNCQDPFLLR